MTKADPIKAPSDVQGRSPGRNLSAAAPEFWSGVADEYHRTHYRAPAGYPSLKVRHRYILDMFREDGLRVLDVGCGPGEMLLDLLDRGCAVSGMDISESMIELARKNTQEHPRVSSLDLRVGDITSMPYESATFDAVICAGVIEYLDSDQPALVELCRVLKRGGALIVSVRNAACPARAIDLLTGRLKKVRHSRALLGATKRVVERNPAADIVFTPYRKHFVSAFHRHLARAGFENEDFRYFHFYPFFVPFDKLAPRLFVAAGLKMETLSRTWLGWLGSGYIVRARKTGAGA
jgi:ubiquinone/menaquinone biosynthesis C-methylase UbiE